MSSPIYRVSPSENAASLEIAGLVDLVDIRPSKALDYLIRRLDAEGVIGEISLHEMRRAIELSFEVVDTL